MKATRPLLKNSTGTLDSEPSNDYDGQVVLGSEVVVSFTQIREHGKRGLDEDGGGQ